MTRRIRAGFLGVLLFLLALLVVPLGIKISAQQRDDVRTTAQASARALANAEEERLGDPGDAEGPRGRTAPTVDAGDGVVILGSRGQTLVTAGRRVPGSVVAAIRSRREPHAPDAVVVSAPIGSPGDPHGTVILARDTEPLENRVRALWLALAAAAATTLALGAVIATGLARWIGRPLHELGIAATRMGHGDVSVRTESTHGPPEVRAVALAFNEMAERLGGLLDSQRAMTADVSHQLRTPLAALQLRLELLADDLHGDARSELTDALREIGRLNRLVDGLLAIARAEETSAKPSAVDATDVVRDRVEMWHPLAQERGIALEVETEPTVAHVTPGHLEQVLDNLLANALDALSRGDHVTLSVQREATAVRITVADDGPGMSPSRRATALARYAGDGSGRKAGLGLAIVARLLAADRGSVVLEETRGGGLTVVVRLPCAAPQDERPLIGPSRHA
jgi:signal transduction histidine kinase